MAFSTVLWDMDGTLIDSEPTALQAMRHALGDEGITVPESFYDLIIGMAADRIHDLLTSSYGLDLPALAWEQRKLDHHLRLIKDVNPIPAALALWTTLEDRGVQQAIVTNSDRLLVDANLRRAGLNRPGLISVSRNDVTEGKPSPEPYLRAQHLLGAPATDCLVLEDSESGALSGLASGAATFLVPGAQCSPIKGTVQLETYRSVLDLLQTPEACP